MEKNYETVTFFVNKLSLDVLAANKTASTVDERVYASHLTHILRNILVIVNKTPFTGQSKVVDEVYSLLAAEKNDPRTKNLPDWLEAILD